MRRIYRKGQWIEFDHTAIESLHAVHQDTMSPLKHPVNGKIYDSRSAYEKATRELGLDIVGNDLLSNKPRNIPDKITDSVLKDAMEKAEAIVYDPSRLRAHNNRNNERYEIQQKLLGKK